MEKCAKCIKENKIAKIGTKKIVGYTIQTKQNKKQKNKNKIKTLQAGYKIKRRKLYRM